MCGSRRLSKCSRTASPANGNMPWQISPSARLASRARRDHRRGSGPERQVGRRSLGIPAVDDGSEPEPRRDRAGVGAQQAVAVEQGLASTDRRVRASSTRCSAIKTASTTRPTATIALLLGMKGAMSEFELVTLRNRLLRGSRNKAERGELFFAVPLGIPQDSLGRDRPGARRAGPRDDPAGLREVRGTRFRVRGLSLPGRE